AVKLAVLVPGSMVQKVEPEASEPILLVVAPCTTVRLATSMVRTSPVPSVSRKANRSPVVRLVRTGLIAGPVIVIVGRASAVPLLVKIAVPPPAEVNCTGKVSGKVTPDG